VSGESASRVCVFGGSRPGRRESYALAARALVGELGRRELGLVYGGGNVGLMNELAESALTLGVHVIGVIPEGLRVREVAHLGLPDLRVVDSMLERKRLMAELSVAFVAIPGGLGTYDELFEMLTWSQLRIHEKPCGVLNVEGYFDPLLALVGRAVEEGFLREDHAARLLVEDAPAALLDRLLPRTGPGVPGR
jgi:uncharacterized protein (TIGR00730 family)